MVITGWKSIADELGVSVSTAKTLRLSGLPVVNLTARRVTVLREDLRAWVGRRRPTSADVSVDGARPDTVGVGT